VTEFRDRGGYCGYGKATVQALAERIVDARMGDVAPLEEVERTAAALGLALPLRSLADLCRSAAGIAASSHRAAIVVSDEFLSHDVEPPRGRRQACVEIRLVAYDVASGLPLNGALASGQSPVRTDAVSNTDLIAEAARQAVGDAVRTMRWNPLPLGRILATYTRSAQIDRGAREGFFTGQTTSVMRGHETVCVGTIGRVEADRTEITFARVYGSPAPGDRVRGTFVPPNPSARLLDARERVGAAPAPQ
jgi:hypothetical protein